MSMIVTTEAPSLGEPLPVELMNTIWADRDGVHDALSDAVRLNRWLAAVSEDEVLADLARPPSSVADGSIRRSVLSDFRSLRDALRTLAGDVARDTRPVSRAHACTVGEAIDTVNRSCARAPSWSRLEVPKKGSPRRRLVTASSPPESALAVIAEAAADLFSSDQAAELRACYAPGCVLYFIRDHPRRQWCSAACGNRARVSRHYARHHGGA